MRLVSSQERRLAAVSLWRCSRMMRVWACTAVWLTEGRDATAHPEPQQGESTTEAPTAGASRLATRGKPSLFFALGAAAACDLVVTGAAPRAACLAATAAVMLAAPATASATTEAMSPVTASTVGQDGCPDVIITLPAVFSVSVNATAGGDATISIRTLPCITSGTGFNASGTCTKSTRTRALGPCLLCAVR